MSVLARGLDPLDPHRFWVAPDLQEISAARHRLAELTESWALPLSPAAFKDVELLFSELVTNAVRYTQAACAVCVGWDGKRLRVEVADVGADEIEVGQPAPDAEGGRGLVLVRALAAAWGIEPSPMGKRIWFEIGADSAMDDDEYFTSLVCAAAQQA